MRKWTYAFFLSIAAGAASDARLAAPFRSAAVLLAAGLVLAGCAAGGNPAAENSPAASSEAPSDLGLARCPAGLRPVAVAEMFFGLGRAGGPPIREDEWARYVREVLTPAFPAGLTIVAAQGQWRDVPRRRLVREAARYVLVAEDLPSDAGRDAPDMAARLSRAIEDYKRRFDQRSVGLLLSRRCGAF